jgi:exopolysaccharide/PEP-CTERM locus tyrosine autokinase
MNRSVEAAPKNAPSRESARRPDIFSRAAVDGRGAAFDRTGLVDMNIVHPSIVAAGMDYTPVSEEYKKLKSRIVELTTKDTFKNTLAVTSSVSDEGKSITATNLAISLSQDYDHAVILIDADMRRPTLHTYLNRMPDKGLSDCLINGVDPDAVLMPIGSDKLSFLPAGKRVDDPVEFFASRGMQVFMRDLKTRYADRYIIVDTPPALLFAETKMISSFADGTILVVKEGLATLENISETIDILKAVNIMGIVYNNASQQNMNGRSYYHYYSHYQVKGRK